ncbi:unnamed protein product [Euphydryas editha]|uniref:Reverse transcriptase n=1 Tax=Euphydryas editha TaxID=104508 RepID=A0AAU9UZN0_EUPED|nr:unnamed protein product [Euphydryas editha]
MEDQFTPNPPHTTNANVVRHHTAVDEKVERFLSGPAPMLPGVEPISLSELRRAVFRLPKRKAPGSDGITNLGKDRRLPGSYRPITLLSHIAKLFERLLLRRMSPHLPLTQCTCGAVWILQQPLDDAPASEGR